MPAPLEIPVIGYPTPNPADRILSEVHDRLLAVKNVVYPGTPHPNVREYSGYVFARQVAIEGTEKFVRRIWVNTRACEDVYNASRTFSGESNSEPIFTRTYLALRETYAPLGKLTALTGVIGVTVTAGGSSYANAPAISFSGGSGSGAAATAIVFRGALVAIVMTSEGTGYTSAPAVVITPVGAGSGATATAAIQPTTALLVEEKAQRMEGDPLDGLYLAVTRVYETLPGPTLTKIIATFTSTQFLVESRQRVALFTDSTLATKTFPSSFTGMLSSRIEPESPVVGWRINRYFTNASGVVLDGTSGKDLPYTTHKAYDDKNRVWIYTIEMEALSANFDTGLFGQTTKIGDLWNNSSDIFAHNALASVTVVDPGSGYTFADPSTVAVAAPNVTGTQAGAVITSLKAVTLDMVAAGAGQTHTALNGTLFFGAGTSTAANVGSAIVDEAEVASISVSDAGSGYLPGDWVSGDGGDPVDTTTAINHYGLAPYHVLYGGASRGYAANDVITLESSTGETAATVTVLTVNASGRVLTFEVTTAGEYIEGVTVTNGRAEYLEQVSVSPSGGTGFRMRPRFAVISTELVGDDGRVVIQAATASVASATVATVGTNHLPGDTLTGTNGTFSTAATFTVTSVGLVSGVVSSIANHGTGHAIGGTITLGTGATGTPPVLTTVTLGLVSVAVNAAGGTTGSGYTFSSTLTMVGGTGTAATVTPATLKLVGGSYNARGSGYAINDVLTPTFSGQTFSVQGTLNVTSLGLVSIALNAGGTGYTNGDTLTMVGGTGTAATLTVTGESGGVITSVSIASAGDYTVSSATFTCTGGTGTGATFQTALYGIGTLAVNTAGNWSAFSSNSNASTTVSPGGGTGATVNGLFGFITATVVTIGSYSGSIPTTFTSTGGGSTGATFQTPAWGTSTWTVTTPGAVTNSPATLTQSAGTGSGFVLGTLVFGVAAVNYSTAGNYTVAPVSTLSTTSSGSGGTTCTLNVAWSPNWTVQSGGRYTLSLVDSFTQYNTSGSGTGISFTAPSWKPLSLSISAGGVFTSSLSSNPVTMRTAESSGTIDITGTASYGINVITVNTAGGGYRVNPITVTISGGSGTGAILRGVADSPQKISVNGYIVGGSIVEPNDQRTLKKTLIVSAIPPTRIDYEPIGYEFPALLTINPENSAFQTPQQGFDFTLDPHKRAQFNAQVTHDFQIGEWAIEDMPSTFALVSPANGSSFFPVPANCVHPAFTWLSYRYSGNTLEILRKEKFEASSPAYVAGDIIVVKAWPEQWRGRIFERIVYRLAENRQL